MPANPPNDQPMDGQTLSLDELSREAGVTPRTVRYYIAEGLLPPPLTTGRNAQYAPEHLDRLRLITQMKEDFLPLKEIRKRLHDLDPEDFSMPMSPPPSPAVASPPREESAPRSARYEPRASSRPASDDNDAASYIDRLIRESGPDYQPHQRYRRRESRRASAEERDPWLRLPIGDDAELVIRERAYNQRRDQLRAALKWIERILNES